MLQKIKTSLSPCTCREKYSTHSQLKRIVTMIYSPKELVGAATVVNGSGVDRVDVLKLVGPVKDFQ